MSSSASESDSDSDEDESASWDVVIAPPPSPDSAAKDVEKLNITDAVNPNEPGVDPIDFYAPSSARSSGDVAADAAETVSADSPPVPPSAPELDLPKTSQEVSRNHIS